MGKFKRQVPDAEADGAEESLHKIVATVTAAPKGIQKAEQAAYQEAVASQLRAEPEANPWASLIPEREQVFIHACIQTGDASMALAVVRGRGIELGSWAQEGDPDWLHQQLLQNPLMAAFSRLCAQAVINGTGLAVAVSRLTKILRDDTAKASSQVAAAKVMFDAAGMLGRAGVEGAQDGAAALKRASSGTGQSAAELLASFDERIAQHKALLAELQEGRMTAAVGPAKGKVIDVEE
jgi:hypothetical protein